MRLRFKVKSIEVSVALLRIRGSANRDLRQHRVKWFERNMDLDALGRFAVWRDGRHLFIIDGQHRKVALENLGLGDWAVRCDEYSGMTFNEACDMFLKLNDSLTVGTYDKFDKGWKAGRAECVETKRIVESHGLRVAQSYGDGNLVCVAAATRSWKLDATGEALDLALTWAIGGWGHTSGAVEGQIVSGLAILAHRRGDEIDTAALVKKLAKYEGGPGRLFGAGKGYAEQNGGTVAFGVANVVRTLYNKGRRNGGIGPL